MAFFADGPIYYHYQNWLGTERMRTTYNGTVEGSYPSLPFGDGLSATGGDDDACHFAGLDHDASSDTEYAPYRQYGSSQGRWMTPDPYIGSYDLSNPQSMNRYAYARNNPLTYVDPLGLNDCDGSVTFDPTSATSTICVSGGGGGDSGGDDGGDGSVITVFGDDGGDGSGVSGPGPGDGQNGGNPPGGGGSGPGGSSATNSAPNNAPTQNAFQCGAAAAANVSAAAGLSNIPGLGSGVGGFIANAVGGNAFSSLTDLISSFGSGSGGGHSVFYNMGQGVVAGPTQGFGAAFGSAIEGTPWAADLVDVGTTALVGAEYATGIGEAKLIYDGVTYVGAVGGCLAGVIH